MADLKVLSFTGNGLIVVQSRITGTEQQAVIRDAASIGQLAGEIGSTFTVMANGTQPWTLRVQHRLPDGTWEDSLIRLGAKSTSGTTPIQIVESERDVSAGGNRDFADLVLRVESAAAVTTTPMTLPFSGNAHVVVHSKTATAEQRFQIENAQTPTSPGTLAGTVGSAVDVVAKPDTPWTLRLQQKNSAGTFVDRPLVLGPLTTQPGLNIQFVVPGDKQDITARVEQPMARPPTSDTFAVVRGLVQQADATVVVGATVSLFNQRLRGGDLALGDPTTTGSDGRYVIMYKRVAGGAFNLYIQAKQGTTVLGTSSVVLNAGAEETIDLVVGGTFTGPSDFSRNRQALDPVLAAEGLTVTNLPQSVDRELAVLSARSGLDPVETVLLKQSVTLSQQTGIAQEIFYGLGRQRVPLSLPAILALDPDARRASMQRALAANQIPAARSAEVDGALAKLAQMSLDESLRDPKTPSETTLGGLLATAGLTVAKRQALASAFAASKAPTTADFWQGVRQSGVLTSTEVTKTQFALQLGVVTQNHLPLVLALQGRGVTDLKGLAQFSQNDWIGLIRSQVSGQTVGVPPDLQAAGVDETAYARMLFTTVEDAFPTSIVAARAASFPSSQLVSQFLTRNPSYDLRTTTVTSFLRTTPGAADFVTDPTQRAGLVRQLQGMERIYRIAPPGARVDTMALLVGAGVDSAQKIHTIGRSAFVERFGPNLGQDTATAMFTRASNMTATARTLLTRFGAAFNRSPMAVLAPRPTSVQAFPDYPALFGSTDFCSCEDCQSVAGAAAYLVDVLHWLDTRPPAGEAGTPLDVMFTGRRADIGTIELSCQNTNTPLPYIDLVNEVLELQVSPTESPPSYQTRGEAADLAAHPEHLWGPAYDVLAGAAASSGRDAVFPFNLPYNLWLDEARTYLAELGLPRSGLMEAFHTPSRAATLTDPVVAVEALEMSQLEADIVAGTVLQPPRLARDFWGRSGDAAYVQALTQVSAFLAAAAPPLAHDGMDYTELTDLVKTDFMQGGGTVGIWFNNVTCDITGAILPGLTADSLDRVHRFVRARRRLGWSAADLDRAITVLGGGQLTQALLVKLASVKRLQAQLAVPLPEMLTWWGPLDTRRWAKRLVTGVPAGAPQGTQGEGFVFNRTLTPTALRAEDQSSYDRLFQSRSVGADPDPAFNLSPDGKALANETSPLAAHIPAVAAALGVTAEELDKLSARLTGAPNVLLTLDNLSKLFHHVSLGRALGIDAGTLLSLLDLTGLDPFDQAHPENAVLLFEELAAIRASGFSVAELDYLLRHLDTKPATLEPQDAPIGVLLLELRDLLRKVEADNADPAPGSAPDQLREQLARELAKLFSPAQVTALLALVDLAPGASPPAGGAPLIDQTLGTFMPAPLVAAAKLALTDPTSQVFLTDRGVRLAFVLSPLVAHLRAEATRAAVIDKLAANLGIGPAVMAPLLEEVLFHPGAGGRSDLAVFSDPALVAFDRKEGGSDAPAVPTPADFPDQFAAYKRLHKVSLVLSHFKIVKEEINWVFRSGPARGTLDFQTLPLAPPAAGDVHYAGWARLRDAFALRDRVTGGRLFDLFDAAEAAATGTAAAQAAAFEQLLTELGKRTRWERADVEFLVGAPARGATPAQPGALGFTYPESWRDERALDRVDQIMTAVRRIGLPAATLFPWRLIPATTALQATQAGDVKQAVRARLGEARWREVTRPLRERLRERQRDALASWLIAHDSRFGNVFDLFDILLLDVEMGACQLTSRIKQAISSTQLFVQRVLLGSEQPNVRLGDGDVREWKWMKSFRVWEANRRVFLYPENLIEPELRDDKSPFFRELEDELLQGDLTDESAERAVLGYLEKLDEVGRLEVAAFVHHQEGDTDVLHVIGRTRSAPHRYFYRQLVDGRRWTAWERIDLDIEGNHLVAAVHNRRLYLFWALITEAAVQTIPDTPVPDDPSKNKPQQAPVKYFQIRLAFAERRDGKWSKKRVSKEQVGATDDDFDRLWDGLLKGGIGGDDPSFLFLRVSEDDSSGDLFVEPVRRILNFGKDQSSRWSYLRLDRFRLSGCDGNLTLERNPLEQNITVQSPVSAPTSDQFFASDTQPSGLIISRPAQTSGLASDLKILGQTPTQFELIPSRQTDSWIGDPFFVEDLRRSFFVVPTAVPLNTFARPAWTFNDNVGLDFSQRLGNLAFPIGILRPPIPRPNPLALDPRNNVGTPTQLVRDTTPTLRSINPAAVGGPLIDRIATRVANAPGAAVTVLGAAPPVALSSSLALEMHAVILDATGGITDIVSPGASAALTSGLSSVQANLVFRQPPSVIDFGPAVIPALRSIPDAGFRFQTFYHPWVCLLRRELNRVGLDGLLAPTADGPGAGLVRQSQVADFFATDYLPAAVSQPFPSDVFDFRYDGAYALYNWELFFHIPLLVATALTRNRRFEEALRWFHAIFDPTGSDDQPALQRVWKFRPFFEEFAGESADRGPIQDLLLLLQYNGSDPAKLSARDDLLNQIADSRKNPFNPHVLARLRPIAYQKAVVIKYIDNLVQWGDELFRRDTLESINEATLYYMLAARLLGRRPREVKVDPPAPSTFNDLRAAGLDAFSNALVEQAESFIAGVPDGTPEGGDDDPPVLGPTLFFCVPPNDKLIADGWDRVEDRLFKIRHCMNIEGVTRQLALFEPPIDPALLVRAAAAGIDLGSVLNDVGGALPFQRYSVIAQRAMDLCNEVRNLGQSLLAALEKKDAEHLALVRANHETRLYDASVEVRKRQIEEAQRALEAAQRSREMADIRLKYYRSREFMSGAEKAQIALMTGAGILDIAAGEANVFASVVGLIPDFDLGASGFGGSPVVTARIGGSTFAAVARAMADSFRVAASTVDRAANMSSIVGSHQRRFDDWAFQGDLAQKEIEQLDRQILAAEIRVAIAERELDNLQLQIDQSREVEELLRDKFTSEELYTWMVGQISTLYFQSYQLAYDVAKRAERTWQFELAEPSKTFIQFGYWDGLRKGLLAGDRLYLDLQRMATAYLEENRREYELTRHVSLRQLDPVALVQLRRDGECFVRIPEAWFDLDSPGHYLRRLRNVSVTIPSVTGPYVSVRLTLTLVSNSVRSSSDPGLQYGRTGTDDARFRDAAVGIQSIVTSRAQDDAGLFETNMRDDRYLPFEGAGAISEWRLELPKQFRQFDYETISDVVLHLRYTARSGGDRLRDAAQAALADTLRKMVLPSIPAGSDNDRQGLVMLLSAATEAPDRWQAFLRPPEAQADQTLSLELGPDAFPFMAQGPNLKIAGVDAFLLLTDATGYQTVGLRVRAAGDTSPDANLPALQLPSTPDSFGGLPHGGVSFSASPKSTGTWVVRFLEQDNAGSTGGAITTIAGHTRLDPARVRDLVLAVRYRV